MIFTSFTKRNLNAGTYTSPSVDTQNLRPYTLFRVTGLMDSADVHDPTLSIVIRLEGTDDGGFTWKPLVAGVWHGGPDSVEDPHPAPSLTWRATDMDRVQRLRLVLDIPKRISIGGTVEVT